MIGLAYKGAYRLRVQNRKKKKNRLLSLQCFYVLTRICQLAAQEWLNTPDMHLTRLDLLNARPCAQGYGNEWPRN